MRKPGGIILALVLLAGSSLAQTSTNTPPASSPPASSNSWAYTLYAYTYFLPGAENYVNPNFTADRGGLHLEARYNYEAQKTGSLWVGHNFSVGKKLVFDVTPMIGGVFGDLTGVAPGYNFSLTYEKVSLNSQGEYVFDTNERSGNFFYTWSELDYSPWEWFRTGIVIQRTKAYHTEFDIQRGLMAGFTYRKLDIATYFFNFGWTDPTVVLAVGLNF